MDLYILHTSFNRVAGIERVIYNTVTFFLEKNKNAKIHLILCSSATELVLDISSFNPYVYFLNVHLSPEQGRVQTLKAHLSIIQKIKKKIAVDAPAILLGTNPLYTFCLFSAFRDNKNIKRYISTEHFSMTEAGFLSKIVRKLFYRYFTVVTLTEEDRVLIEKKYKPAECLCIPNCTPFEPRSYEYLPEKKMVLALGRLTEQKGFDMLIEAFSLIAEKYQDWKLLIAGDDYGLKKQLQKMITDHGLSNVEICHARADVEYLYDQASFFVLSSRFEGFPMVLLEAMSFGLPIISFDCPTGPADLIDDSNGSLIDNGNIKKLAQAVECYINNPELLMKKSEGASEKIQHFTKSKISKIWHEIL